MNLQREFAFDAPMSPDALSTRSAFAPVPAPRKRVREVCREVNNRLRDEAKDDRLAGRETKADQVHRCLAAFFNKYAYWPTPAELTLRMFETGEIPTNRTQLVAPRLSEGVNGVVKRDAAGNKVRQGGGLYELLPLRTCKVNGDDAHPVRIVER